MVNVCWPTPVAGVSTEKASVPNKASKIRPNDLSRRLNSSSPSFQRFIRSDERGVSRVPKPVSSRALTTFSLKEYAA